MNKLYLRILRNLLIKSNQSIKIINNLKDKISHVKEKNQRNGQQRKRC